MGEKVQRRMFEGKASVRRKDRTKGNQTESKLDTFRRWWCKFWQSNKWRFVVFYATIRSTADGGLDIKLPLDYWLPERRKDFIWRNIYGKYALIYLIKHLCTKINRFMINYVNTLLFIQFSHFQVNTERNNFFKVSKDALDSYRTNANRQLPRLLQGMVSANYIEYKSNSFKIILKLNLIATNLSYYLFIEHLSTWKLPTSLSKQTRVDDDCRERRRKNIKKRARSFVYCIVWKNLSISLKCWWSTFKMFPLHSISRRSTVHWQAIDKI